MNNKLKENRHILIFSLIWLIASLIQAYFTELHEDEAYYWVFSEYLNWGYFDHPPMIAFLVKLGYLLFENELGVRLFPSLLGAGTIFIIYRLLPQGLREIRLYILVISSISLMHINVAGFMALPDISLVFFTALFFLVLKHYLAEDKLPQALGLGLIVALMMYSKYHAALILFFTLLAQRKLLLRRSFWIIVMVATILYLPHIFWQVKHDFVSFRYHLVDRNTAFRFGYILEYIGNQVLVTGPLTGVLLLYLSFSRPAADVFEKILKFNLVGFFAFFLLSSVRGHVEPHWTAAAFIPMIILSLLQLRKRPRLRKWLIIMGFASIPLVVIMRLYLMVEILPLPSRISRDFHGKDTWISQIQEVAGDRPVIFRSKFQYPSLYRFYAQKPAFTRNSMYYRRNQYDVWPMEKEMQGRDVMLIAYSYDPWKDSLKTVFGTLYYYNIESYCSFNNLRVEIHTDRIDAASGDTITLPISIWNPNDYSVCLDCPCDIPPYLELAFFRDDGDRFYCRMVEEPDQSVYDPGETREFDVRVHIHAPAGNYRIRIGYTSEILNQGINSRVLNGVITPPPLQP